MDRLRRPAKQLIELRHLEDRSGLALIATLMLIALVAMLTAAALNGAVSALRTSGSDYQDTRVYYAAEAGGEATLAQLKAMLSDGHLSDADLLNINPPTLSYIEFDSFYVERLGDAIVETVTDGPYAGLNALTQNVDIYSSAKNPLGDRSAIILRAKAQAIPIFQFGVFFEQDLEATNGPPMEFLGRVHSNGNIYLSSNNAWYRDIITTPNEIFHDRKDFHSVKNGVFINDASGNEIALNFDSRTYSDPEAFKAQSCSAFDCRVMTGAFDVDSLRIPLPLGTPAYEVIRPREGDDSEAERQIKLAWKADTYVTVDLVNVRTLGDVCGGTPPKYDPDAVDGVLSITALDPVIPGNSVDFKILGVNCDGFNADVTVYADGATVYSKELIGECRFKVDIPSAVDGIRVEVLGADNDGEGVDGTAYWHDLLSVMAEADRLWPNITVDRSMGGEALSQTDMCKIFQWEWSDFYDGRETELKDVLNIDMTQLAAWEAVSTARQTEIVYVEFLVPAEVGNYAPVTRDYLPDATVDPAVRLVNGSLLPNRLTVATEWPLYVRGDYNSIDKKSTSLMGDGITILSNAWDDADNRPAQNDIDTCTGLVSWTNPCIEYTKWQPKWKKQSSSETTVNGAILAGHWATPCDHHETSCAADGSTAYYKDWYGGGLENFPRFLEHWRNGSNKVDFNYLGSLISPFTSQKTTGTWNGTYYTPPQRNWAFDIDFRDPANLPPGTPNVGYVFRTAMREAY